MVRYALGTKVRVASMEEAGFGAADIARVRALLRKKRRRADPEVQVLEDVACLVFLEHYLDDFIGKHTEPKIVTILQKTWLKMSPDGRAAALALPLSEAAGSLVEKALA